MFLNASAWWNHAWTFEELLWLERVVDLCHWKLQVKSNIYSSNVRNCTFLSLVCIPSVRHCALHLLFRKCGSSQFFFLTLWIVFLFAVFFRHCSFWSVYQGHCRVFYFHISWSLPSASVPFAFCLFRSSVSDLFFVCLFCHCPFEWCTLLERFLSVFVCFSQSKSREPGWILFLNCSWISFLSDAKHDLKARAEGTKIARRWIIVFWSRIFHVDFVQMFLSKAALGCDRSLNANGMLPRFPAVRTSSRAPKKTNRRFTHFVIVASERLDLLHPKKAVDKFEGKHSTYNIISKAKVLKFDSAIKCRAFEKVKQAGHLQCDVAVLMIICSNQRD